MEAIKAEAQEKSGGNFELDKSLEGMHPMTNFFHLNINGGTTVKVKTKICRRSSCSKVGHLKVYKLFAGSRIHSTVRLQWDAKIFNQGLMYLTSYTSSLLDSEILRIGTTTIQLATCVRREVH